MKTLRLILILATVAVSANSQTISDFFNPSTKIVWLGVDYSHVKLIGDFSQFYGAGEKSDYSIKTTYFPAWNELILNEREKYDFKSALQKQTLIYNIDTVTAINRRADVENLAAQNSPAYTPEEIKSFVSEYTFDKDDNAIGILYVAETLNKSSTIAVYHFVAINLSNQEILFQERLTGKPSGFGIRNYWGGSIYSSIKQIRREYPNSWKGKYL